MISSTEYPINKRFQTHFAIVLGGNAITEIVSGTLADYMSTTYKGFRVFRINYVNASDIPDLPATTHGFMLNMFSGIGMQIYWNMSNKMYYRSKNGTGTVSAWYEVSAAALTA